MKLDVRTDFKLMRKRHFSVRSAGKAANKYCYLKIALCKCRQTLILMWSLLTVLVSDFR